MILNPALMLALFPRRDASTRTEPATKKQRLLPTPPATQNSQLSFADVLERIQLDAQENTRAFLPLIDPHAHSLITRRV
jgi:hypothetical protein